jgi:hypothetical protein
MKNNSIVDLCHLAWGKKWYRNVTVNGSKTISCKSLIQKINKEGKQVATFLLIMYQRTVSEISLTTSTPCGFVYNSRQSFLNYFPKLKLKHSLLEFFVSTSSVNFLFDMPCSTYDDRIHFKICRNLPSGLSKCLQKISWLHRAVHTVKLGFTHIHVRPTRIIQLFVIQWFDALYNWKLA